MCGNLTFEQARWSIMRIWLEPHVPCGQDEGQNGQDDRIQTTYGRQKVSPTDSAVSQIILIRVVADFSDCFVAQTRWINWTAGYQANRWKKLIDLIKRSRYFKVMGCQLIAFAEKKVEQRYRASQHMKNHWIR